MKAGCLDGYMRSISKDQARPSSLPHEIWTWKAGTKQHTTLQRAFLDFILIDKLPLSEVEGEGIRQLMQLLEPRFEPPGRTFVSQECRLFHPQFI